MSALAQSLKGHWSWIASLFLVGLGAKFWLIFHCSSAFPYLDQWPGEAIALYIPYLSHQYSAALLFKAHNEHRIVLSRLIELLLLISNGQWDAQLEMVVNAVIYCAGIAGFGWSLATLLGKKYWPVLWFTLAALLALPIAWENTLWGFQLPFYFLPLFSMLTICGLGLGKPVSFLWFLGAFGAIAAAFNLASGFLAVVAVAGVILWEWICRRQNPRRELATLIFCGVMVIMGILLASHVAFHPPSTRAFLTAFGKNLAWPWPLHAWYAIFNLLPLASLAWRHFSSPDEAGPVGRLTLMIGLWVVLQSAAAAYGRAVVGTTPPWRYMDLLGFLMLANLLSILVLLARRQKSPSMRHFQPVVFSAWALACAGGLWSLTERAWTIYIPQLQVEQRAQLKVSREFLASNDPRILAGVPASQLPVENVDADIWLLRHPLVRAILPACARQGLPVSPASPGGAFARNGCGLVEPESSGEICWGSYTTATNHERGRFESLPINPGALSYLEIPVAGNLAAAGNSLELVEVASGKTIAIEPPQIAPGQWQLVRVREPGGPFKVVAGNGSADWFAFKEPREMGRLSYCAIVLMSSWNWILTAGLILLVLSLIQHRSSARIPSRA